MTGKHGYTDPFDIDEEKIKAGPELSVPELVASQESGRAKSGRLIREADVQERETIWETMQAEVQKGYATEVPEGLREAGGAPPVYFRRFLAPQLKPDKPGWVRKARAIDGGRMAGVNKCALVYSPSQLPSVSLYAEALKTFAASRPNEQAKSVKLDQTRP